MSPTAVQTASAKPFYPDTDDQPMAENTRQFSYIVDIKCGLEALFEDQPNVFVAGDLFWYPIEGDPGTRLAPDIMVAFGRPKGHRQSYKQWEEDQIAPQVVFEVLSPSNRHTEMLRKFSFYERFGVEEYYIYDPEPGKFQLAGYERDPAMSRLVEIPQMIGHTSSRLGVRFEVEGESLRLLAADGTPLPTFATLLESKRRIESDNQQLRQFLREKGFEPPI